MFKLFLIVLLVAIPGVLRAQLELRTNGAPQTAFSGRLRNIEVTFHNRDLKPAETTIRTQLYQASSATVVPLGKPAEWKQVEVLPGQTIMESAPLTFPEVKSGTHFVIQWLDENNKSLGRTDVTVYPTNLLQALRPMSGDKPIGVFDPQNQLKPLLKGLEIEIEDLANTGLAGFSGKLAIIGPFQSWAQMRENLTNQIPALAKKGKAIVWIQPPPEKSDKLKPSYYASMEARGSAVIVQPELVADLPENPQSQLNLIYFCQLALNPGNPVLPTQDH